MLLQPRLESADLRVRQHRIKEDHRLLRSGESDGRTQVGRQVFFPLTCRELAGGNRDAGLLIPNDKSWSTFNGILSLQTRIQTCGRGLKL